MKLFINYTFSYFPQIIGTQYAIRDWQFRKSKPERRIDIVRLADKLIFFNEEADNYEGNYRI